MKGLSSIYADFICRTSYEKLSPEVVEQAKQRILDLVGVSLAGYKLTEFPRLVVSYLASLGGTPEATIFVTKKKLPAINAAMANGVCAHALDMDDGHRFAALHPGAVVIPASIAAAEMIGASTRDLIAGVVVGYEVMIRIGMAINPSSLGRGFHTTGTVGTFGAAASSANIMKLSYDETVGALGLAGLQGSGILQVNHDVEGAKVKPINPAKAAMSGLFSSILAREGCRGPVNVLEGEDGFLRATADEVRKELLTRRLGEEFEIKNVYNKLYAACRHAHASMDAVFEACGTEVNPGEIRKLSIKTYPAAVRLAGITHPSTPSAARFSIPFSVALILTKKDAGADKYCDETIGDPDIQKLADKVELSADSKWEKLYPEKRGATATITDVGNRVYSAEVGLPRGEPENPASEKEIHNKFLANTTLVVTKEHAERLANIIKNLENVSLKEFTGLL